MVFLSCGLSSIPLLAHSITDLKLMQMHNLEARTCLFSDPDMDPFQQTVLRLNVRNVHDSTPANSQVIGFHFEWIVNQYPTALARNSPFKTWRISEIPGSEACWAQGFALAMGEHVLVVTYMVTIHSANFSHITARQKIPLTNFWTYGYIGTSLLQHAILDNNDCCSNWIVRYMREMIYI